MASEQKGPSQRKQRAREHKREAKSSRAPNKAEEWQSPIEKRGAAEHTEKTEEKKRGNKKTRCKKGHGGKGNKGRGEGRGREVKREEGKGGGWRCNRKE